MKKKLFTTAAVLLLLLTMLPSALAEIYAGPEEIELGEKLDHLVATVPADSQVDVDPDTLPEGVDLALEPEQDTNMEDIYLRGTPLHVGNYSCLISINAANYVCPISVSAEAPTVQVCEPVRCYQGASAQVSVTATVSMGSLSYQWYRSADNSTYGTAIEGATQPVCPVDTANVGTSYYYCVVTNTVDSSARGVTSGVISVTVEALAVSSISVETLPVKTVYTVGETLDPAGLSLRVNYANGSSQVQTDTSAFSLYPTRLETAGTQNIELSYQGLKCTFQVTVQPGSEVIEGIGVLTLPTKRSYTVGDSLDTAGLSIRVYTNNGQRDVTEGFICSPLVFDRAGEQTVTVSYGDKTCTFTLTVQEEEKPASLIVKTLPTKRDYTVGETLDTTGLVLQEISTRNRARDVTEGFSCSPTELTVAGDRQQITVWYGDLSCTFNVNVKAAAQTSPPVSSPPVSAAPVNSPAVTNPPAAPAAPVQSPSVPQGTVPTSPPPTSHVIEHQSHETGAGSAFIVVIVVAAALGLGSLGGYVVIMNHGGFDAVAEKLKEFTARFRKK